jgi:hypothetical protein
MPNKPYVIKQGDYLAKLAHRLCFDVDKVWNDGANAELKQKRGDGTMLCPGDILFIPDEPPKKLPLSSKTTNSYVADVPKVKLEITLAKGGKPLADLAYVIEGIGDDTEKKTDASGKVVIEAPVHVREVMLVLPTRGDRQAIKIGELDPVSEPSGARMRLNNLGLMGKGFAGADNYEAHDEDRLRAALRSFQTARGLERTGELDDATQTALRQAHGS